MTQHGSNERKKRVRDVAITVHLETFRLGKDSEGMRNALAQIAMRLLDPDDRVLFHQADGGTSLMDHLARIVEEQATLNHAWQSSSLFGSVWAEYEVKDSLLFTLVALCHAAIDGKIAKELHELGALSILFSLYQVLPEKLQDYGQYILEIFRNLCFFDVDGDLFPIGFVQAIWDLVLQPDEASRQEVAADILCNIACNEPRRTNATQERIATLLTHFFSPTSNTNARIAVTDLLCNLCADSAYCLLLIYELDERRPPNQRRHSGAVYLVDITEKTEHTALRRSMEALVHNISWSDPTSKRNIQKVALSNFMSLFAVELAINN